MLAARTRGRHRAVLSVSSAARGGGGAVRAMCLLLVFFREKGSLLGVVVVENGLCRVFTLVDSWVHISPQNGSEPLG